MIFAVHPKVATNTPTWYGISAPAFSIALGGLRSRLSKPVGDPRCVRTGLSFRTSVVYIDFLFQATKPLGESVFFEWEWGSVPLLRSAACVPSRSCHASAGRLHPLSFP